MTEKTIREAINEALRQEMQRDPRVVVRGEDIAGGDRGLWPELQPVFHGINRNKLSVTLNLKTDEGQRIFRRLVETADVVTENMRPDVKFRLKVDYETLAALNLARGSAASAGGFAVNAGAGQNFGIVEDASAVTLNDVSSSTALNFGFSGQRQLRDQRIELFDSP